MVTSYVLSWLVDALQFGDSVFLVQFLYEIPLSDDVSKTIIKDKMKIARLVRSAIAVKSLLCAHTQTLSYIQRLSSLIFFNVVVEGV